MPKLLLDYLNRPRFQILYYIFKKGKLSCDNSKTQMSRSFGYKSVGHFWDEFSSELQINRRI